MFNRLLFVAFTLFLSSCASQQVEIKPIEHLSIVLSRQTFDSLELVDGEVWLRKAGNLVATYKSIKKQDKFASAVDEVQAGFALMKAKGAIKIWDNNVKYGFLAETNHFKTYYIAHKKNRDYWALISLKEELAKPLLQ